MPHEGVRHLVTVSVAVALAWGVLDSRLDAQEPQRTEVQEQPQTQQDRRREALQLLGKAELAAEQGRTQQALEIAQQAQRLYPDSLAIAAFIESLKKQLETKPTRTAPFLKAKAHLAAAVSRAQWLMSQRRYSEAVDLLKGVVQAAALFPEAADVAFYKEVAERELARYEDAVARGEIRPARPPKRPKKEGVRQARLDITDFPEGPENAYRLVRVAREAVPRWYVQLKTGLQRKMTVNYRNMPFGLVLDDIRRTTGVTIIVDEPVQAARTTALALVDFRAKSITAETVLSVACELAGCEYVILPKGVVVTTKDKAADYVRSLPESIAETWARGRYLFPELYVDITRQLPLPEVTPEQVEEEENVPPYLRSGKALVAHIEKLLR